MKVFLIIFSGFYMLGCQPMDTTPKASVEEAELAPVLKDEGGKKTASIPSSSTKPQQLFSSESSELGDSNAVIQPGALATESEVTIEEGVEIVDTKAKKELGLEDKYEPFSKPLNISSSSEIDGAVPLTISLEMNESLSLTKGIGKIFVAFYILETKDGPKLGTVPTMEISVKGSLANFDFQTEGTYTKASFQLAAIEFSGAISKEVTSERTVAPKEEVPDENEEEETGESEEEEPNEDETFTCPDRIDVAKIDSSIEICGVRGTLDLTNLKPENILSGKSIAGIAGTIDLSNLKSENIISGQTIAGVSGSLTLNSYNDCASEGEVGCLTTSSFPSVDISSLASKVVSGQSVSGISGSSTNILYSNCTAANQSGCVATSTYKTMDLSSKDASGALNLNASGFNARLGSASLFEYWDENGSRHTNTGDADLIAANIKSGTELFGITGTSSTYSNCTAANQSGCVSTSTYKTMDLSAKDAGGAIDLTNAVFDARIKSSSVFEYWDETGTRYTDTGDEHITATNIVDGVDIFGVTGTHSSSPDCSSIAVGGTWILVPGDADYGTNDFCVMKYEAKNNSGVPTSTAADTPWVSIDQQDSKTECASLGKGYHLITNDEWMTIATNVAAQGTNWDGGEVGTNEMTRGHSDDNPSNACAADADDANAYVETDCTGASSGDDFNQRRTHTLSNGEVIWDLAGNVSEWTSYFNDEEKPTPVANAWDEFTNLTGTTTMPLTDLIPQVAIDNTWNSTESIGKYYPGNDASGGALLRGGYWSGTTNTGLFAAILQSSPTYTVSNTGFRCVVSVP